MSDAMHDIIDDDRVRTYKDIIQDCMHKNRLDVAIGLCDVGRECVGSKYKCCFDGFRKQLIVIQNEKHKKCEH